MNAVKTDPLQSPVENLERVLVAPAQKNARDWTEQVGNALGGLLKGLRDHESGAEAPNGTLAVLNNPKQDMAPKLDRAVQQFRFEHVHFNDCARELLQKVDSLRNRVQTGGSASLPELEAIQREGNDLLTRVRNHQDAEDKLLRETMVVEVGAGD